MKKLIIVLMLALLLVGCGKHDATITVGDDVVWTDGKTEYKTNQLFETLKTQEYAPIVLRDIVENIATFENLDTTSINENANLDVDEIVNAYGEYYFQYYGTTVEEYRKSYYFQALLIELTKISINESFDSYLADNAPYKAEIAYFDNIDNANAVIDATKEDEHTFAYSAAEQGYTQEITEQIYTDSSDLPLEVKDYMLNSSKLGISDVIQSSTIATDAEGNSTITPRYYVVNLISKNVEDFKDEYVDWLIANVIDSNEIITKYMTKYNVKFYDQRTYELFKETYGDFH